MPIFGWILAWLLNLSPLLTWIYVGQNIEVSIINMLLTIMKIVLFPVLLGVLINNYFGKYLAKIQHILPILAILIIALIIAIITALNIENLQELTTSVAVILHNILGLTAGYLIARLIGYDLKTAKTIEVGMQNSGLGAALAIKYFGTIAALFSIWHNISGYLLARYWQNKD